MSTISTEHAELARKFPYKKFRADEVSAFLQVVYQRAFEVIKENGFGATVIPMITTVSPGSSPRDAENNGRVVTLWGHLPENDLSKAEKVISQLASEFPGSFSCSIVNPNFKLGEGWRIALDPHITGYAHPLHELLCPKI